MSSKFSLYTNYYNGAFFFKKNTLCSTFPLSPFV